MTTKTMTPNEINKRIALFCKWKQLSSYFGGVEGLWEDPNGKQQSTIPNYHGDLNAMHEAEKILNCELSQRDEYMAELECLVLGRCDVPYDHFRMSTCSAAQRAEAFLRTIGQWEDEK